MEEVCRPLNEQCIKINQFLREVLINFSVDTDISRMHVCMHVFWKIVTNMNKNLCECGTFMWTHRYASTCVVTKTSTANQFSSNVGTTEIEFYFYLFDFDSHSFRHTRFFIESKKIE